MTPKHTIDALRDSIRLSDVDRKTGASFVKIDTRVLTWLLDDAEALQAVATLELEPAQ